MNEPFTPTRYRLVNTATGRVFSDEGWTLDDPQADAPALVRTQYASRQIAVRPNDWGLYKYCDWLPVSRRLQGSAAPVTYRSHGLAAELGLNNLYITLNGYFPEAGAFMTTCSFKETEAYSVCGRLNPADGRVLVVASAGNTARAFAKVCSENRIPLLLCVPEDNLNALWFEKPLDPCVKLIASRSGSDYFDAIHLGNIAVKNPRYVAEGGAKNVARRDGMGTTVLSAVIAIGSVPDYYFQAVGSGTGAIAAWEANLRFLEDGRFGQNLMKLIVSQNYPFVPMYHAWQAGSRDLLPLDDNEARAQVETIDAKVLSNRKPPYSVAGGLYDALCATGGEVVHVDNGLAREAAQLFERCEGIDLHPAAAVAVASLVDYVRAGKLDRDAVVMLNITGCGERRFKQGKKLFYLQPDRVFDIDPDETEVLAFLEGLFG